MEISDLIATAGTWLQGTGPESDVVISTRIRLARNLAGIPFLIKMDDGHQAETEQTITDAIAKADLPHALTFFSMPDIGPLDRSLMVERHLISPELARQQGHCGVALARDETISIMVNEEDHIRIQVIRAGLSLEAAYEEATLVDDRLEEHLDYAFSTRYGYLTACPTNVGTALRASVMLHLPALVLTRQIDKVFQAVTKMRLAVRGLHGEGTQASGDFYQISNQVTLGRSEEEILQALKVAIDEVIRYERTARQALLTQGEDFLKDKVWRALALLQSARMIPSEETMMLLSAVRMGINVGLADRADEADKAADEDNKNDKPPFPDIKTVNELFILTQPAHLQKMRGQELSEHQRDTFRADYLRERLN